MKLATFTTTDNPSPRTGIVQAESILDLSTVGVTSEMKTIIKGGVDLSLIHI